MSAASCAPTSSRPQAPLPAGDAGERELLLDIFLLDKAVYELGYELNNRPDWARIPLRGIIDLMSGRVETGVAG